MKKLKVKQCVMTCSACPSQWDIYTEDGQYVYGRYRWGVLSLTLYSWRGGEKTLYAEKIGDSLDGIMSTSEMRELTKEILDWE